MPTPAKNPAPPPAGCLWTPEAARRIGLTVKTLYTYKHQGKAPGGCFEIARKLAWPIEDLDAWLAAQRNQPANRDAEHDSRPPEPSHAPRQRRPAPRKTALATP